GSINRRSFGGQDMPTTPVLSIDASALKGIDFGSYITSLFAGAGAGAGDYGPTMTLTVTLTAPNGQGVELQHRLRCVLQGFRALQLPAYARADVEPDDAGRAPRHA